MASTEERKLYGKELSLTIVPAPSNETSIVTSNFVYVNKEDFSHAVYLQVNKCIFTAVTHDDIKKGCVALNKIQRQAARVSDGTLVKCILFTPPKVNFHLSRIDFEIDFINPKAFVDEVDFDAEKLIQHFHEKYANQIFCVSQQFVISFEGYMMLVKVLQMEVLDTKSLISKDDEYGDIREIPTMGMFLKTTNIVLTKGQHSKIKFYNLKSTAKPGTFKMDFNFEELGIGGLDAEFSAIFRRAFAARVLPPEVVKKLGIKFVKGVLLYGPPGTGKTLIARQIGKMLNCHEPKIVNGPEILNKYVGESEKNIRELFTDAEIEQEEKGDDSQLHLIIFDEIDAICKQRGTVRGGTGVNDSVVNQLLSKIDGVKPLNNVLIIGMTNRLDLIDEALLRPGRFEVKIEIGLPDEAGRLQIFKIHTKKMRQNKMLDKNVDLKELAARTKNFSGAEIEGLVKSATSFAVQRKVDVHNITKPTDTEHIVVTMEDFENAFLDVIPAFGVSTDEFESYLQQGLIDYGPKFTKVLNTCESFVNQVKTSSQTNLLSVLLEGPEGAGKTALAAHLAVNSGYPYVKVVSPQRMIGYSEHEKVHQIAKIFDDAYKSPLSLIVLDDIERLIEYVNLGPRFSNSILQALLIMIKKSAPKNRKLMIIGTTSNAQALSELGILKAFNVVIHTPLLDQPKEIREVLVKTEAFSKDNTEELDKAVKACPKKIGIKNLLLAIEMARSRTDMNAEKAGPTVTVSELLQSLKDCDCFDIEDEL